MLFFYIERGKKDQFFQTWYSLVESTPDTKITEVLLMIFFILYPINPLFADPEKRSRLFDSEELRMYLQENSDFVSQYAELLPYFALPYILNPVDHPNFSHLFTKKWFEDIKRKALACVKTIPQSPTMLENLVSASLSSPRNMKFLSADSGVRQSLPIFKPEMTFAPPEEADRLIHMNFASVVYDLNNTANESQLCALLQALRWRLTQTDTETSTLVLDSYIRFNVLSTSKPHDFLLDRLLTSTRRIKEYSISLINAIAHKKQGRDYLLTKENLIKLITKILYDEKNTTNLLRTSLSVLQKLSMKKQGQISMITLDMIKWALRIMKKEMPSVDEELIEFCTAILMNLSVRSIAKSKFEEVDTEILHALAKCLNSKNPSIVKYVHCLAYTLFSYKSFRNTGRKLGFDKLLKNLKSLSDEEASKRIDLILEQIDGQEDNNTSLMSDIDSEDACVVLDDDLNDIIPDPNILKGNELLRAKYEFKPLATETKPSVMDTNSEGGFMSRDKIPRTPYN